MARTHITGPSFTGINIPQGQVATQFTARFGGTYGATTSAAAPTLWSTSSHTGRLPFGVWDGVTGFTDSNRGMFDVPFVLAADFIPATLSATIIAASQSPGAGAIVLASANVAGANTPSAPALTLVKDPTQATRLRLDTPRALRFVSGGNDSGNTFTVKGFDEYGVPLTETVTGANAGTATGKKAWFDIVSITHTGTIAGTLTIGTTDIYGFPIRVDKFAFLDPYWNDVALNTVGTAVFVAADTTTATATTGDVRGTFTGASASDGTKTMQLFIASPQAANPDPAAVFGVTQFGA